jgi:hypothetical protein
MTKGDNHMARREGGEGWSHPNRKYVPVQRVELRPRRGSVSTADEAIDFKLDYQTR